MINTILSLGTNLGDRNKNMGEMIEQVKEVLQSPVKVSKVMETEPVEAPDEQQWYLNCIVSGYYDSSARSLLEVCQQIEKRLGRKDKNTHKARTADLDILLVGDCIINDNDFTVPHPQLLKRRFCIEGIASIEPDWVHPVEKKTFRKLCEIIDKHIMEQKIRFIGI